MDEPKKTSTEVIGDIMKSAAEIARTSLGPSHNAQDVFTVAQMILDHAREMRAG